VLHLQLQLRVLLAQRLQLPALCLGRLGVRDAEDGAVHLTFIWVIQLGVNAIIVELPIELRDLR
jgi:hypothetical protein